MTKLNSRAELIEMLKDLLLVETNARDRYIKEGASFHDAELKVTMETIKEDEDRHIEMIGELIGILEA